MNQAVDLGLCIDPLVFILYKFGHMFTGMEYADLRRRE